MITSKLNKNIVDIKQFNNLEVMNFINLAQKFKKGLKITLTRPVYAMNLFFENSTRTHTSFEMAERRLGLQILPFDPKTSSITKGESLLDTLKTLQAIGINLAVIRHPQNNYYRSILASNLKLSLINAGDGSGQHPSQSLLDMLTIYEKFSHFRNLKVGIVGDLSHSRVARSDMALLNQLGAEVFFSGPKKWYLKKFMKYGKYYSIDQLITQVDVVMLLRVQHERLTEAGDKKFNTEVYHKKFGLTHERANLMKPTSIIMHPAPVNRGVEISPDLVESPQSRIFKQMQNGVFMRMAMISNVLASQRLIEPLNLETR